MKEIVHNPKQKLSPKPTLAGRRQLSNDEAITLISTRLRDDVIGAGTAYGVEPRLVAAILMDEASLYNVWDRLQDLVAWWIIQSKGKLSLLITRAWQILTREDIGTQSFGMAQMNVNTLRELIGEGYLPPSEFDTELPAILKVLLDVDMCPRLAAAQIRHIIDHWMEQGVDISQRPEICGTLYSIGLEGARGVHANPEPNLRGLEIARAAKDLDM